MTAPVGRSKRFDRSIIEGPIRTAVWRLAWPTTIQNLVGWLQGMIAHALVGHLVGYAGNAAIGVSVEVFILFIPVLTSLYTGMAVLIARFAGADDQETVDRVVYQVLLTTVILSALVAVAGYFGAPALLDLVKAAPQVRGEALPYLRVLFVGMLGLLLFFALSTAFRAAGDARTPLRLGVILTVLTITSNIILIPLFGTIGAAIGTVTSNSLVGLYGLWLLTRPSSVISFRLDLVRGPDFSIIRSLFRFGLPTCGQSLAMRAAAVVLLRFVGSLEHSAAAQAAYAVGFIQLFSLVTWTSAALMGAAATVAGQSLGAGDPKRAIAGVHVASRMGVGFAALVGLVFLTVPRTLLGVFGMTDPAVVEVGVELLRYLSLSGLFVSISMSYTGGLQGTGDTRSPFFIALLSHMILPIALCMIFEALGVLEAHEIWLALVAGHFTRCLLTVVRFEQQKWRHIRVDIEPAR